MNPIEILILDFDNTVTSTSGGRTPEKLISSKILALCEARKNSNPYTCFYICTARDVKQYPAYLLRYAKAHHLADGEKPLMIKRKDIKHHFGQKNVFLSSFISLATKTFSALTGIELARVSISDDTATKEYTKCGDAYDHCILPYETQVLATFDETNLSIDLHDMPHDHECTYLTTGKEYQLLQILDHAREKFPDRELNFTFIDDMIRHCQTAANIFENIDGVKMNVKWAHEDGLKDILPEKKMETPKEPNSSLLFQMKSEMEFSPGVTVCYNITCGKNRRGSTSLYEEHEGIVYAIEEAKMIRQEITTACKTTADVTFTIKGKIGNTTYDFDTNDLDAAEQYLSTTLAAKNSVGITCQP